jgi:hypothetical protein
MEAAVFMVIAALPAEEFSTLVSITDFTRGFLTMSFTRDFVVFIQDSVTTVFIPDSVSMSFIQASIIIMDFTRNSVTAGFITVFVTEGSATGFITDFSANRLSPVCQTDAYGRARRHRQRGLSLWARNEENGCPLLDDLFIPNPGGSVPEPVTRMSHSPHCGKTIG